MYAALLELHPSLVHISEEMEVRRCDDVEAVVRVEFFLDVAQLLSHVLNALWRERAVEMVAIVVVFAPSFKHTMVELELADEVVWWLVEVCRCRLRPQSRSSRIH